MLYLLVAEDVMGAYCLLNQYNININIWIDVKILNSNRQNNLNFLYWPECNLKKFKKTQFHNFFYFNNQYELFQKHPTNKALFLNYWKKGEDKARCRWVQSLCRFQVSCNDIFKISNDRIQAFWIIYIFLVKTAEGVWLPRKQSFFHYYNII